MKSPFQNIGIVTRPNTPEIENTAHTLIDFLHGEGFDIYLDEQSINDGAVYADDAKRCISASMAELG